MPIIESLFFDSTTALVGFYENYGSEIGFSDCGIIGSNDSGKTWYATNFAPVSQGVTSIARMGSVVFAGSGDGIFASRDTFATWRRIGGTLEGDLDTHVGKNPVNKKKQTVSVSISVGRQAPVVSVWVKADALTSISLFDLQGRRVVEIMKPAVLPAGTYRVPLGSGGKAVGRAKGVLVCRVKAGAVEKTFVVPAIGK